MSESDNATIGLVRKLATSVVPAPGPDYAEELRALVVSRMREAQLQARERELRSARWRRTIAWVAAAMLPSLAIGTAWYVSRSSPPAAPVAAVAPQPARVETSALGVQVVHAAAPAEVAVAHSAEIRAGDTVVTSSQGPADVTMPSGARLLLAPSTRLSVDWLPPGSHAVREHVVMAAGVADISVPKLGQQGSFSVSTPDTEVVVHGTRFTVRVFERSPGAWGTDVSVAEGHVSVRHAGEESMLSPGQAWATPTSAPPAPSSVPSAASAEPTTEPPAPVPTQGDRRAPANSLAAENALFESALAASRAGDESRAISLLDRLLSEYPRSPLVGMAQRERARAQQRLDERRDESNR